MKTGRHTWTTTTTRRPKERNAKTHDSSAQELISKHHGTPAHQRTHRIRPTNNPAEKAP